MHPGVTKLFIFRVTIKYVSNERIFFLECDKFRLRSNNLTRIKTVTLKIFQVCTISKFISNAV